MSTHPALKGMRSCVCPIKKNTPRKEHFTYEIQKFKKAGIFSIGVLWEEPGPDRITRFVKGSKLSSP